MTFQNKDSQKQVFSVHKDILTYVLSIKSKA